MCQYKISYRYRLQKYLSIILVLCAMIIYCCISHRYKTYIRCHLIYQFWYYMYRHWYYKYCRVTSFIALENIRREDVLTIYIWVVSEIIFACFFCTCVKFFIWVYVHVSVGMNSWVKLASGVSICCWVFVSIHFSMCVPVCIFVWVIGVLLCVFV